MNYIKLLNMDRLKNSIEISVVIPAYNCKSTLTKVISNLWDQTNESNGMEIIVIDDGSIDSTKDWLEQLNLKPTVSLKCFFQKHQGAAAARNYGIINAKGDIILFLDADIIPGNLLISEHVHFHRLHPQDNVALRGRTAEITTSANGKLMRPNVAAFKTKMIDNNNLPWIEFLSGNISLKRKFIIENHLLFNEKLAICEDVEFGFRAQQQGVVIHYRDPAVAYHDHAITLRDYLKKGRLSGQSYAIWYKDFPSLTTALERLGIEHYYGFIGTHRPIRWKYKQYAKHLAVNLVTSPFFLSLGTLLLRLSSGNRFFWFYRQVYESNFRRAFRKQLRILQK